MIQHLLALVLLSVPLSSYTMDESPKEFSPNQLFDLFINLFDASRQIPTPEIPKDFDSAQYGVLLAYDEKSKIAVTHLGSMLKLRNGVWTFIKKGEYNNHNDFIQKYPSFVSAWKQTPTYKGYTPYIQQKMSPMHPYIERNSFPNYAYHEDTNTLAYIEYENTTYKRLDPKDISTIGSFVKHRGLKTNIVFEHNGKRIACLENDTSVESVAYVDKIIFNSNASRCAYISVITDIIDGKHHQAVNIIERKKDGTYAHKIPTSQLRISNFKRNEDGTYTHTIPQHKLNISLTPYPKLKNVYFEDDNTTLQIINDGADLNSWTVPSK